MSTTWKQYARQLYKIEQSYYPKVLKALKTVYSSFTSDIQAQGIDRARSNLNMQPFNQELLPIIQDLYKRVGLWGANLQYGELKTGKKASETVMLRKAGGFGRNDSWIADVLEFLRKYAIEMVQRITETQRQDILNILQQGIDDNLTLDQIIAQLSDAGIVETRARTIARTEIVRAANVGHQVGAKTFPYEVNKKWQGAGDHRERHSHRLLNDQMIGEDDLFKVPIYKGDKPTGSFDMMAAPGDPTASASNTINCRCRVTFQAKRDEKGRLIMRQNATPVVQFRPSTIDITPDLEQIRAII